MAGRLDQPHATVIWAVPFEKRGAVDPLNEVNVNFGQARTTMLITAFF